MCMICVGSIFLLLREHDMCMIYISHVHDMCREFLVVVVGITICLGSLGDKKVDNPRCGEKQE